MTKKDFIEMKYDELTQLTSINEEFSDLYGSISNTKLRKILMTLHSVFKDNFINMNRSLPTLNGSVRFWSKGCKELRIYIGFTFDLCRELNGSDYEFKIDEYYLKVLKECLEFLNWDENIPPYTKKIDIYYTIPIFLPKQGLILSNSKGLTFELKQIGSGSYANVYKYKDTFYQRIFVLKKAKKELSTKELDRFEVEYQEMKNLSSPYIVDVFCYNKDENEYIMEYMDYTLDAYISKYNSQLSLNCRVNIVIQILKAFNYIHFKERLHRDISPKNILIKKYEDTIVVKIADFGLVKVPDSQMTTLSTDFKGYFNDPSLIVDGFSTYNMSHETYALTRIIYYVMTGKTNPENCQDSDLKILIDKGLNANKNERYKDVNEIVSAFQQYVDNKFS